MPNHITYRPPFPVPVPVLLRVPHYGCECCRAYVRYVLASIDPGRAQIQILHEWDSCCFAAGGLHSSLLDYNLGVAKLLNSSNHNFSGGGGGGAAETGYFRTVVTSGNYHQVNVRDKVIVAVAVEWLRRWVQAREHAVVLVTSFALPAWLTWHLMLVCFFLCEGSGLLQAILSVVGLSRRSTCCSKMTMKPQTLESFVCFNRAFVRMLTCMLWHGVSAKAYSSCCNLYGTTAYKINNIARHVRVKSDGLTMNHK